MKRDFIDILMDIMLAALCILALAQVAGLVMMIAVEIWKNVGGLPWTME